METSQQFLNVLLNQSPIVVGMAFVIYTLWKVYQKEKEQKEALADKVITNNILVQEQLKDMIEMQKKMVDTLDQIRHGKSN
jgi:predicted nucleic-acid-binding protein